MDKFTSQNTPAQSVAEMEKEIRSLKRKVDLLEMNLTRARLISSTQNRVDMIWRDSLKKEIQFFQLILENMTSILLLLDFDGRFAYASKEFLTDADIASFGLINGRHFEDVLRSRMPKEKFDKFDAAVKCAVRKRETVTLELETDFSGSGNLRTFFILITPMIDDDGKHTGIMALFNDITVINNALESAKRANLAKTNFLANMSHEIRTPLNAVIGMAAIARNSSDMDKMYYCLDKINDSSNHLLGVINDILDMSKIESSHFNLSFSEFVFEKMLLRISDVMRFKMEEKRIEFSINCDPAIPYAIYSDEQRFSQVIVNLLSNAIKFTPDNGSVSIRAEVESRVGDDCMLRISVSDSGIGISDEQRPRLFKAFSQADGSISRKFGGTGLGLIISKNIIRMLGGDISFQSSEGKGTTFTFTVKTRACALKPSVKVSRKGVRILAVDDMPDVRESFSLYSEKIGVHCSVAASAKEARELLVREDYDIIFVDWKMPEVDGLSFVKSLTEISEKQMIVIMISAADWSGIEREAKRAGVKEFISKPILLPVIENVLDKYCEGESKNETGFFADFSGKKILLVDDVEINREIILSLLADSGVEIECAENGREAVEKVAAAASPFDFIFMDVQMPEMDGYEASRRIRAAEKEDGRTAVPIVAMTANVFKEDVERCLAAGMNDHVGKPVNFDEIIAKIKRYTE